MPSSTRFTPPEEKILVFQYTIGATEKSCVNAIFLQTIVPEHILLVFGMPENARATHEANENFLYDGELLTFAGALRWIGLDLECSGGKGESCWGGGLACAFQIPFAQWHVAQVFL